MPKKDQRWAAAELAALKKAELELLQAAAYWDCVAEASGAGVKTEVSEVQALNGLLSKAHSYARALEEFHL